MRKTFQIWLLVFVAIAFVVTLSVSFLIQTQQSLVHSETLIRERMADACEQIESNNENLVAVLKDNYAEAMTKAKIFSTFLNEDVSRAADGEWMKQMLLTLNVDELHVIDATGTITYSTDPEVIGYKMASSEQSALFLDLLGKPGAGLVQDPRARGYHDGKIMQYAGFALASGEGIAQIGFYPERLQESLELADIANLSPSLRIGSEGEIAVIQNGTVISDGNRGYIGKSLAELGVDAERFSDGKAHLLKFDGKINLCAMTSYAEYELLGMIPRDELYTTRHQTSGVLVVSYLILFLTAFAVISWLVQRVVINGIYLVNDSLKKITSGDLDERVEVENNPEFRLLSSGINATVDSLKQAIAETAARIDAELEFAKSIQFSCVPNVFPPYPDHDEFDIYATMDTAREVGGDFYDFFLLNGTYLGFVIADVSGKGIGAAMYMMRAKTQIKNQMLAGGALEQVIFDVNNDLCEGNDTGMFVTAFACVCDLATAQLSYVNAGHNPPLIRHANGDFTYMGGKRGFVLGGMPGSRYQVNTQPLFAGDTLFLYTDGVTEAVNPALELFGEARLQTLLNGADMRGLDMCALLSRVRAAVDAFASGAEQADDITMLGVAIRSVQSGDKRLQLPAQRDKLDEALAFVNEVLSPYDVPQRTLSHIDIALDELFTNVASYAYGGKPGEATIECGVKDGVMELTITDCGVPYNPIAKADPDTTLASSERPIGGLGIFLAKKLMDDMRYTNINGLNQVTMIKKLR